MVRNLGQAATLNRLMAQFFWDIRTICRRAPFCITFRGLCNIVPEAVAVRNILAKSAAEALFRIISQMGITKRSLPTKAHCVNFTNYWALNQLAAASITHKQTA